jgi:phospho-N-acetylmuramoyl-pentapeptide-transferase
VTPPALLLAGAAGSWLATGLLLGLARTRGWGKAVRRDGPQGHLVKEGTPTMGGVGFVTVALALGAAALLAGVAATAPPGADVAATRADRWAVLALVLAAATLGAWDDRTSLGRARRDAEGDDASTGVLARWRLLAQGAAGLAFGGWAVAQGHAMLGPAWLDVPAFAFVVVGSVNALNFTDGLDGLAAGSAAVMLLAFWGDPFAAALLGALLGFLWFNAHPARLFMGGVGAEALGAAVAGLAIVHGDVWRLPILALVPVAEVLSVIVQVGVFRLAGGRRLLRMSPLHHHFELGGWPETRVVARFWLVTAGATALATWSRAWW